MGKVVIYTQDNGGVSVVVPSPEAVAQYGIDAIAKKDVPSGKPYKIIDASEIPADRTFRAAWTIDHALLTDGVGADFDSFGDLM